METEKEIIEKYNLLLSGEYKGNAFNTWCLNRDNIKNYILSNSQEITDNYTNPSYLQRLKYIFEDKIIYHCNCGKPLKWRNFTKGYNKTCGDNNCVNIQNVKSVKKYYQKNHGVDHLFSTEKFKNELKEKFIEKYGVDNPWKSEIIKRKIKDTNIERFGEDSWLKVEKNRKYISKKVTENNSKNRIELIKKYQIPIKLNELDYSISEVGIICESCLNKSKFSTSYFNNKIRIGENPCLTCNPPLYSESTGEIEVFDYIKSILDKNIKIEKNYRKNLKGKEIDIYIESLNIGFEFDGTYWHSEIFKGKFGNLEKKEFIQGKQIKLYNIWEDQWLNKKDIIKSRILNAFGKSNILYARNCMIKEVDTRTEREFLDCNHIQGYTASKIKLGLFNKDTLVALMTFGKRRKSLGANSIEGEYELIRFCNKLETSIVGGASKLFSFFIKNYQFDKIISYQDNSWYAGNLYEKLGFNFINKTSPNYYWCKGNLRFNRFNFRKDKLIREGFDPNKTENEIMLQRGYYKSWDYGNLKWEFKKRSI